jgi:protein gp37
MDTRYGRVKWGAGNPRSRTSVDNWKQPRKWDREAAKLGVRHRVFCASLADWLDDEVPIEWLTDLLTLIAATPNLDWLLLTKRPENWYRRISLAEGEMAESWIDCRGSIPQNVWIGTSAEDQTRWDERMPELLRIPAVVRFVSAEPLLSAIHMGGVRPDWLIVGGESGPGARPMDPLWVESLCDQCQEPALPVAFLFKQWGGVDKHATGRLLDGRTFDELPTPVVSGMLNGEHSNTPEPRP